MSLRSRTLVRGVTLAEAIIASFILVAAMAVSSALYHTALQHSVSIDRRHLGSRAAERRIEQIRSWSRDKHGTNGTMEFTQGWDAYDKITTTDPDYPGYSVYTEIAAKPVFSPSSEFEEIQFSALEDDNIPDDTNEKRALENSSYLVTVTASWGEGPKDHVTTRALIADPVRDYGCKNEPGEKAISISFNGSSAAPATLPVGEPVLLSAVVKDAHGALVENPAVQWYIDAEHSSGNGTIRTRPSSPTEAIFTNEVKVERTPGNPASAVTVHTGGSVVLIARVRLGGIEAINRTPSIGLQD